MYSNLFLDFIYQNIAEIRALIRDLSVISGGIIGLRSYLSQQRQRQIDNSKKLIEQFQNAIDKDDLNQWEQVLLNSYESIGTEPGHFIVFDNNEKPIQIPHANLFISEGKGFYFSGGKMNRGDDVSDINFGSIRHITEQLNIISYEVLYGHTELIILYYELGQIITSIYYWIDSIEDEDLKKNTYPYFFQMYRKNKRRLEKLPYKIYQGLC